MKTVQASSEWLLTKDDLLKNGSDCYFNAIISDLVYKVYHQFKEMIELNPREDGVIYKFIFSISEMDDNDE